MLLASMVKMRVSTVTEGRGHLVCRGAWFKPNPVFKGKDGVVRA